MKRLGILCPHGGFKVPKLKQWVMCGFSEVENNSLKMTPRCRNM